MKTDIIQNIKDCGQALIDNAERIANSYAYSTRTVITCYVDHTEDYPTISVDSTFIPEEFIRRRS